MPKPKASPKRVDTTVEFLSGPETMGPYPYCCDAQILLRGPVLILDVNDEGWVTLQGTQPSGLPYYEAENHDYGVTIQARWALVGDRWLGVWLEDDAEYYFVVHTGALS